MAEEERVRTVCAVAFEQTSLGAFILDVLNGFCYIGTFDSQNLRQQISEVSQIYAPSHMILSSSLPSDTIDAIEKSGSSIIVNVSQSSYEFQKSLDSLVEISFAAPFDQQEQSKNSFISSIIQSKLLVGSIGAAISFLTSRSIKIIISSINPIQISHGLKLSSSSYMELGIINQNSAKRSCSDDLFSIMNRCATSMGSSTLRKWFLSPLSSVQSISDRQDIIATLVLPDNQHFVSTTISRMRSISEVRRILIRLAKGTTQTRHWKTLSSSLLNASSLGSYIRSTLPSLNFHLSDFSQLANKLSKAFSASSIADGFDPALDRLRAAKARLADTINEAAKELISNLPSTSNVSSLTVVFIPQYGFLTSIPIGELPNGYKMIFQSETSQFCKNDRMETLDNTIGDVSKDSEERELKIISSLSDEVLQKSNEISQTWESIGQLDALCSIAAISIEGCYVRPKVAEKATLRILNGRNPLLERKVAHFVPNSTEESKKVTVLIGPNSSGKSSLLRQIALIVFLSHIGSYVPAESAIIPWTDNIFTMFHFGNAEPFSSSFAEELKRVSEAIVGSTDRSLVIFDEFGKSTCESDGGSLFCSLLVHWGKMGEKAPIAFLSTHFEKYLSPMFVDNSYFDCISMEIAESDSVIYLYKAGKRRGRSLAMHCALRAGLQSHIVARAVDVKQAFEDGGEIAEIPNLEDAELDNKCKRGLTIFFRYKEGDSIKEMLESVEREVISNDC